MEYFSENIYEIVGRYNCTAIINFKEGTEELEKYGEELVGQFLYSNRERASVFSRLQNLDSPSRSTHEKIRFLPSDTSLFTEDKLLEMRKNGINSESIDYLQYLKPIFIVDPHAEDELKKIPNTSTIDIDLGSPAELINITNTLLKRKEEDNWDLIQEEIASYIATELHYENNRSNELKEKYQVDGSDLTNERIDFHYYQFKSWLIGDKMSEEEQLKLILLQAKQFQRTYDHFIGELGKSINHPENEIKNNPELRKIVGRHCRLFNPERLVHKTPAIWWNEKSFAHIVVRHGYEIAQALELENGTTFQYTHKELVRVIKMVCEQIHSEFEAYDGETFYREGNRAIEFNGNHYCLRINKDGLLIQFFPYEKIS